MRPGVGGDTCMIVLVMSQLLALGGFPHRSPAFRTVRSCVTKRRQAVALQRFCLPSSTGVTSVLNI